nr:hypothetical protein GCM10020063_078800 [Dactylosporangium thailandense]
MRTVAPARHRSALARRRCQARGWSPRSNVRPSSADLRHQLPRRRGCPTPDHDRRALAPESHSHTAEAKNLTLDHLAPPPEARSHTAEGKDPSPLDRDRA